MPCDTFETPHGPIIVCSRGRGHRERKCHACGSPAKFLCDFPMKRKGSTCSRALCAFHVRPQPAGADFCIEHDTAFREATGLKALPKAAISPAQDERQLSIFERRK